MQTNELASCSLKILRSFAVMFHYPRKIYLLYNQFPSMRIRPRSTEATIFIASTFISISQTKSESIRVLWERIAQASRTFPAMLNAPSEEWNSKFFIAIRVINKAGFYKGGKWRASRVWRFGDLARLLPSQPLFCLYLPLSCALSM